jgi:antagonist of KipI
MFLILRPGLLTTVQDLGRWGYQGMGIPVAGPMDVYSHRYANRLVGNEEQAAALEITLTGPEIVVGGAAVCAVTGARFHMTVDDVQVALDTPFEVGPGTRLRFGARGAGARATLAVRGGFLVAPVHGSRATSLVSRMGPFGGRALRAGDKLPVGYTDRRWPLAQPGACLPMADGGATLRVIEGPHADRFDRSAFELLYGSRFTVTPASNRMGYRLEGPALQPLVTTELLSDATPIGSLQVPSSGQPILLMADRQTTGGYPKIGTVIAADLPCAGQLAPGDWIEFRKTTRAEAVAALKQQMARLGVSG